MLPDFRRVKEALSQRLRDRIQGEVSSDPLLGSINHQTAHEGDGFTVERSDGSTETLEYVAASASFEIPEDRVRAGDPKLIPEAVAAMSEQLAESTSRTLFETLKRATQQAGTALSADDKPFTAELWLEGLAKMELSFREDGEWVPPTLVTGTALAERATAELQRLDTDPALREKLTGLLNQKRQEWRDRESRRQLAD